MAKSGSKSPSFSRLTVTPKVVAPPEAPAGVGRRGAVETDPQGAGDTRRPAPARIEYFAPCTLGVEAALAAELAELGAQEIATRPGGAAFVGDRRLGYAANLWLRSAIRVQDLLLRAPARGKDELYAAVGRIDWSEHMRLDQTLAVDASVRDSELTHSGFAGLTVKDAIVDQFRARTGERPNVNADDPDLPIKLVVKNDAITLWRNLSGESLHKRGYRPVQVKSPLNEATAAGLLRLSGWDRASPIVDPMCGSGTLLIEAALLAADRAPGMNRRFAFERWPDLDAELWRGVQAEARARAKPTLPFTIEGADRHGGAISIAEKSAHDAGVAGLVRFSTADAADWTPVAAIKHAGGQGPALTVITNPPYGERIGEGEDLAGSWRALGRFLNERCRGGHAFVLSGNPDLPRHLGLHASRQIPVMNGPIECRLLEYELR
ncbi:MAG TPA: THUMP domain-containing protein [Planctomycetota bacterium]|nr:THUMP domain-containing protein [Planctomycetota bacterium]